MKISEVIVELEKIKSEHGDVETEVRIYDATSITACDTCNEVFYIRSSGEVTCIISGGD